MKEEAKEEKKLHFQVVRAYFSWVKMIDIIAGVCTALNLYLQHNVSEQQIFYMTEKDIIGMREIHYRRVTYVD